MEEYNSEALKTVEDIANNIPMNINVNPDIYKNSESQNELESKLTDTYNESVNNAEHSGSNSLGNELVSELSNENTEPRTDSPVISNNETNSFKIGSSTVDTLDDVHNTSDNIQNILNTESGGTNDRDNADERMDWTESESDFSVSNAVITSDNLTSDNAKVSNDNTNNILNRDVTMEESANSSQNTVDSDSSQPTQDTLQTEKQSEEPESSDATHKQPESNNIDSEEFFSEDKDTSDLSTGLAMLEDLSEIPSESYPELEPDSAMENGKFVIKGFLSYFFFEIDKYTM